jgi:hypothetical protein
MTSLDPFLRPTRATGGRARDAAESITIRVEAPCANGSAFSRSGNASPTSNSIATGLNLRESNLIERRWRELRADTAHPGPRNLSMRQQASNLPWAREFGFGLAKELRLRTDGFSVGPAFQARAEEAPCVPLPTQQGISLRRRVESAAPSRGVGLEWGYSRRLSTRAPSTTHERLRSPGDPRTTSRAPRAGSTSSPHRSAYWESGCANTLRWLLRRPRSSVDTLHFRAAQFAHHRVDEPLVALQPPM